MRDEHRIVTILAADLVGSTPLSEPLDPEEVKLVLGKIVSRFIRIVEEIGGTVKDTAGDGILATFGGPVAHEDDAERAVCRCILDSTSPTPARQAASLTERIVFGNHPAPFPAFGVKPAPMLL
jgi:class 3 adenylate cyclase